MNVERRQPYWENFVEFCKNHKIVFGLDFDGILFEPRVAVSQRIFEDFRKVLPPEKMNSWTAVEDFILNEEIYRSKERARAYDNWIWTNALVLMQSPMIPGAFEFTLGMERAGIPYFVYTSRIPTLSAPTFATIKTHMPHISLDKVFIRTGTTIAGDDFKAVIAGELGVTDHLDDSPSQAEKIASANPTCKVIVATNSTWEPALTNMFKVRTRGRLPNFFDFYAQVIKNPEILLV